VRAAAEAFLATLTPAQTIRTLFAVDDDEWHPGHERQTPL
jgi:hypothetical protein